MPILKPIAGHTSTARIEAYLEKNGRALARDFYNLYPSARILAATPADFTLKNRRRLLARIATGDFDAIIIGHTSLGFIETPPEDLRLIIDEKVEELESALKTMRANDESKRTQGQIEKKLKTYTERREEMAERTTDQIGVNLKEMGVAATVLVPMTLPHTGPVGEVWCNW